MNLFFLKKLICSAVIFVFFGSCFFIIDLCNATLSGSTSDSSISSGDSNQTPPCVASASQFCAGQDNYFSQWLLNDPSAQAALPGIEIVSVSDHLMSQDQFGKIAAYIESNSLSLQKIDGVTIDVGNIFESIFPNTSKAGVVPVTINPSPTADSAESNKISSKPLPLTPEVVPKENIISADNKEIVDTSLGKKSTGAAPAGLLLGSSTDYSVSEADKNVNIETKTSGNQNDTIGNNSMPSLAQAGSEAVVAAATVGAGATKINSMMPADTGSATGKSTALVGSVANQDSSKQVVAIGTGKDAKAVDSLSQTLQQVDSNGKPVAQSAGAAASDSQTASNAQTTAPTAAEGSAIAGASLQPVNVSGQNSKQIAQLGLSTKPNVILLGEQTKPATVQLGESSKPATVQLGETAKPATVQLGETSKPATVKLGETSKPATVHLGEQTKPAVVQLGNTTTPSTVYLGSNKAPAVAVLSPHYSAYDPPVSYSDWSWGSVVSPGVSGGIYVSVPGASLPTSAPVSTPMPTPTPASAPAPASTPTPTFPAPTSQPAPQNNPSPQSPAASPGIGPPAPAPASNSDGNAAPKTVSVDILGTKVSDSGGPTQSSVDAAAQVNLVKNGASYTATLKADRVTRTDFYINGQSLSTLLYLGFGALNSGSGLWEYVFDSSKYPNGGYELFALITELGGSFQSPRFGFTIDNIAAVDTRQQSVLRSQLVAAQQVVSNVDQAAQTSQAGKTISAALPQGVADSAAFQNSIADFMSAVGQIKQLNNSLQQVQAQSLKIADRIAKLKQELAGLSPKALDSLRNDIVAELNDLRKQKLALDVSLLDLQQKINDLQTKQDAAKLAILNLVSPAQKTAAQDQLASLELTVAQNAQQAIDAQKELTKDSDNDGLSDYDELFVNHTDPYNPDTDGDGFLDGDEVAYGFDPLNPGDHAKITYQDPRLVPPRLAYIYSVDTVSSVIGSNGKTNIKLVGTGLPDSYVELFIYSQPLVVIVKTDNQGRWEYLLGNPLDDGLHTVYAAQINSLGQVEARSQEFVFLKAGASVTSASEDASLSQPTVQQLQGNFGFYTLCLVLIGIGIAFLIMGAAARAVKKESHDPPLPVPGATLR